MTQRFDVAVIGADSAIGAAILDLISERKFPAGEIAALVLDPREDAGVSFAGAELDLEDAQLFDFGQVQLAFLASTDERLMGVAERAADQGCVVVDACGAPWADPAIPVVVADFNDQSLDRFNDRGIVAGPDPLLVPLVLTLAPLHAMAGLRGVSVTAMLPVSDTGRTGLEDLARQTTALLNARFYESTAFPQQIAFNLLGQVGDADAAGQTVRERRVAEQLRDLLTPASELNADFSLVQAPVFYGYAINVEASFDRAIDLAQAAEVLREAPGIELITSAEAAECPSPVTKATGVDAVSVARLRLRTVQPNTVCFWATTDNIRRASALNALMSAERLVRNYL
ncbi:N-acetyl-gamma-glutamyl-phosphate reductase [Sinimarinibacterium sp. CAU 1509]|uniref:Asd/ArgC dimerization domain-containing protein n=1 Tax=Sinimarinibacterium sp. CAU 1509 TaxID=2562283 RepID=UPI0010AC7799|nr:Asd/ArgC dimerization domain-containing protein [Sinimarinibacterium sp. CAU 1509]TJY62238.1 N-acetyl-gamma-glutamyl-phosphate reductase [Sinimarinibacterium sp. CAU 1509]